MDRWIKTLLLWLLLAALPLQGFAAAIQLSCAPSHHASAAPGHHHEDQGPHAHEAHGHHQAGDAHGDSHGKLAHDDNGTCSACASCCLGAAITSPLALNSPSAPPSEAVLLSPLQYLPGYVPPGLERPPRLVSA